MFIRTRTNIDAGSFTLLIKKSGGRTSLVLANPNMQQVIGKNNSISFKYLIININDVNVDSCINDAKRVHNTFIKTQKTTTCNFRKKMNEYPLKCNCLQNNVMYQTNVKSVDNVEEHTLE